MVFTLIIMVIILLVLTPVGIVVDKKIEAYFENKRERTLNSSLLNWKIRILGGNDHEENINIVAMSFTYGLNHGLWYTVNKAD